jgi:hypothetical protein
MEYRQKTRADTLEDCARFTYAIVLTLDKKVAEYNSKY